MTLQRFLLDIRKDLYEELHGIVNFIDRDTCLDIRLCIDRVVALKDDDSEQEYNWCLRTGDSSYDQRHSDYCAAASIDIDTDISDLIDTLTNDLLEQYP